MIASALLLVLGTAFIYNAFAHPLTADGAQILIGSVCLVFSMLLVVYLLREHQ